MTISQDQNFINLLQAVSTVTGLRPEEITKKNRYRRLLYPRQIICYLLRTYYGYTFEYIGKLFGQHHTSVMHSVSSIESMLNINDTIITNLVDQINVELINLGHFNGHKKLTMYVPIKTDLNRLKSLLIEKYGCSFDMF